MDDYDELEMRARGLAKDNAYSNEAMAINRELLRRNLRNTSAINRLARCHEMSADYEKALAHYKLTLKIDPGNRVANSRAKRLEKRIKIAKDVEAIHKSSTYEELMAIAKQSKARGEYDFAIGVVEKALSVKRNTPALTMLASLYRYVRELERAESIYRSILEENPSDEYAMVGCAAVYRDMERLGQAREMYEEVLRRNPRNPAALMGLGAVLKDIGLDQDSVRKFCRARDIGEVQTYDQETLYRIRDRYMVEGNREGAERINRVLQKKPLR